MYIEINWGTLNWAEKMIKINGKDVEVNEELHRLLRKNIAEVENTISGIEEYIMQNI